MMKRTITKISRISDRKPEDCFVPGSSSSRLALIWPLTEEVASLSKEHNVKRRLQRNITVLSRRER